MMIRRHVPGLLWLGVALAPACTATPNILPTNDLNRPTDIAFLCMGAFDQGDGSAKVSGRPMRWCHHPPIDDNRATDQPAPSIQNRTYAFVPNSASGDLSVIDADNWKIVDLDKATGGYGRAPLGTLPEQISATTDGCRVVSANRGSCDMTVVDPSALLASSFAAQYDSMSLNVTVPPGNGLQRVAFVRGDRTVLQAAPYEVVFLPRDISTLTGVDNLCPGGDMSPMEPWHALVTFPSCDLVALVDLPSGEIIASKKVVAGDAMNADPALQLPHLEDAGTSPVCPADCGGDRAPDGGAPDASAPVASGGTFGPTSIAILPRGDQAYVSLSLAPAILSFSLTPTTMTPLPSVKLNDTGQGSNRIRLGIDPWADPTGDFIGKFISYKDRNQSYLYVVARDGSLRIIDVFVPGSETECETNFDPLDAQKDPDPSKAVRVTPDVNCIPYGSVNRRPASANATAGLRFPSVPVDVAAANLSGDTKEDTVNGGYAWVLTSSGTIYLVNISPTSRQIKAVVHQSQTTLFGASIPSEPFVYKNGVPDATNLVNEATPFPNRPRDRNVISYSVALDPSLGPTRLDLPPLGLATGPYIEPLWTQGSEVDATALDNGVRQTYVFFPDRDASIAQGWDVTWQGTVVSPRYSGILNGTKLKDGGGGFCSLGVLPGDIVTLRGCTTTADCPLGLFCDRDQSLDQVPGGFGVTGLCVSQNRMPQDHPVCAPYISSVRRYEIVEARETELTLAPHLDEVVRAGPSPCHIAGQAGTTGAGGATGAAGAMGAGGAGGGAGAGGDMGMAGAGGSGGATAGASGATGMAAGAGGGPAGAGGAAGAGMGGSGGMPTDPFKDDCHDPNDNSTQPFTCTEYKGENRCLNRCLRSQDCRHGRVCLGVCTGDADCPSGKCAADGMCRTNDFCSSLLPCAAGQSCVEGQCEYVGLCADGPPLGADQCFPQLTSYAVNANAAFMVTGTQTGSFSAGTTDQDGRCRPFTPTERDPRLVSRIPLRPYPGQGSPNDILCGPLDAPAAVFPTMQTTTPVDAAPAAGQPVVRKSDGYFIDHFAPALKPDMDLNVPGKLADVAGSGGTARPEAPQLVEWMNTWTKDVKAPNACLYRGGPIDTDPQVLSTDPATRASRPQHLRARFRNTQVAFVIADIERGPPAVTTMHFDVHGGFRQEAVVNLTTVEISAPARLVLGPIDSTRPDMITTKAAPYFFVVDQRRLGRGQGGGPTRGQIVRVNPFGLAANGYLPVFEDYTASGGKFPIQ